MYMTLEKVIDILNILPMKLCAFGLNELKKGWFPYYFNIKENQTNVGPYPDSKNYGHHFMGKKERSEYVLPCVILFLCFSVLLALRLPRLGEERANLSVFRMLDRFLLVRICRFLLPLDVWEGLRFISLRMFYSSITEKGVLQTKHALLRLFGLELSPK